MTTTPYPPLPPEGVTLSDLMGRLKKIESYLDAGDLAAMRELKAQLEAALKERDTAKEQSELKGALLHETACALDSAGVPRGGRLPQRCARLAASWEDRKAERDEALADNAEAAELLSHYVDKPGPLVEMVRALVTQEPDLVAAFAAYLGFFPESVEVSGPCSHKLNIDPHKLGGFEGVSFERTDEFRATVRLRGVRRSRVEVTGGDERLLGDLGLRKIGGLHTGRIDAAPGFTPPAAPAEVKPATFVAPAETGKSYALRERVDEIVRSEAERTGIPVDLLLGRAKPPAVVVKQLSGEPLRYATDGSAGLDLPFAEKAVRLGAYDATLLHTDVRVEIPPGYEGQIRPRSSCPDGLLVCHGTIDSDYRGQLKVKVRNLLERGIVLTRPIAQLVIAPVARAEIVQVDSLSETARGEGGFGSTDGGPGFPKVNLSKYERFAREAGMGGHYSEAEAVLKIHTLEEVEAKVITREREKTPSELQAAADEATLIRRGEAAEVAAKAINRQIKALKVGDEWTDADALKVGEEAMQAAGYGDLLCYFVETSAGRRLKVRDAFEELTPVIGEG